MDRFDIGAVWADAATIDEPVLIALLKGARRAVDAYAPDGTDEEILEMATVMHARHVWASAAGGNNAEFGPDGYQVTASTWPLVMAARDLLRPRGNLLNQVRIR